MELKLLKLEREFLSKTNIYFFDPSVKMFKNTSYTFNRFEYIAWSYVTLIAIDVIHVMCGSYHEGLL